MEHPELFMQGISDFCFPFFFLNRTVYTKKQVLVMFEPDYFLPFAFFFIHVVSNLSPDMHLPQMKLCCCCFCSALFSPL